MLQSKAGRRFSIHEAQRLPIDDDRQAAAARPNGWPELARMPSEPGYAGTGCRLSARSPSVSHRLFSVSLLWRATHVVVRPNGAAFLMTEQQSEVVGWGDMREWPGWPDAWSPRTGWSCNGDGVPEQISTQGRCWILDLVAFVHSGVAVSVGTRDADLKPAFSRAWGPVVSDDGRSLALCVIAPPGSWMRANLDANGPIAVGFSPPTIARALQVEGRRVGVREPARRPIWSGPSGTCPVVRRGGRADRRTPRAFAADVRRAVRLRLRSTLSIDEVFDQTPGPTAGGRL